ncbi:hypothetical protein [Burkholderia stabilis]
MRWSWPPGCTGPACSADSPRVPFIAPETRHGTAESAHQPAEGRRALDGAAPLTTFDHRAIQSLATQFAQADGSGWSVERIVDWAGLGGLGPVLSGSPRTVADALNHWFDATGIDGLDVPYLTLPDSYRQIASLLVPELTRRRRYPGAYAPGSFREKLFGAAARVPDHRIAAQYRW